MLRRLSSSVSARTSAVWLSAAQVRFSATTPEKGSDASSAGSSAAAAPPPPAAAARASETENGQKTPATNESESKPAAYHFPTEDVLNAVKKGDFGKVQSHASELVQKSWRDEYTLPAACAVIFIIAWYWMAWTRRSIRRKCAATEAATRDEARQTIDKVKGPVEQWKKDMSRATSQMQGILDKNSQLTKDIDRMTTALRSCSIRPTPGSLSSRTEPTVDKVKHE